jgi:hypothetical protein
VITKFVEISAEINYYRPTLVCITETWLTLSSMLNLYNISGYVSFFNCRVSEAGGGVMVLVREDLASKQIATAVTCNEAFNCCAVLVGRGAKQTLITCVYRAPWAVLSDMKVMFNELDSILVKYNRIVVAGDFNLKSCTAGAVEIFDNLIMEHNLSLIASQPTRGDALLDLVYVTPDFINSNISDLPPIARSDHSAQLIELPISSVSDVKQRKVVDAKQLGLLLGQLDSTTMFSECRDVDDYANVLTATLLGAIADSTRFKQVCKRQRLPRYIVQLLHTKKKLWRAAKQSKEFSKYKAAKKTARAAIRSHQRNLENRLVYSNNRRAFFSHINDKLYQKKNKIQLLVDDVAVSDGVAADMFAHEFSKNFSGRSDVRAIVTNNINYETDFMPYSSELLIREALTSCSTSNSSPDGISYNLIKQYCYFIIRPLNIVFQQSLAAGKFPSVWKHATIIPLYKGRGDSSSPSSYRPISMCSCLGKLLEKVVQSQLTKYLQSNDLLSTAQHGFISGRSTVTNILSCDAAIADITLLGHAYDSFSFDFKAAFDKAPHRFVVQALADKGIRGKALSWFASFLTGRTQQVKVGECHSAIYDVISGVLQGSVCGPGLYTLLVDSLLRKISLRNWCFADDFKFIADVSVYSQEVIQAEINAVIQWADEHNMPLSEEKCGVMHCGNNQPNYAYNIRGKIMTVYDSFTDLGVLRTNDGYESYCHAVSVKAQVP